jgi:hypothetical protein
MKKILGAVLLIALFVSSAFAKSDERGLVDVGAGTAIRTTAIVTTSDVLSTTFTIPEVGRCKAIHYYISATIGSATNLTFTPAGALDTTVLLGPASTGYYKNNAYAVTVTSTSTIHIRVPIPDDGGYKWHGIVSTGTGTMTSSDALIKYKLEY